MPEQTKHANLTNAIDLFGKSYGVVKRNLNVYALIYAIPAVLAIAAVIQVVDDSQRNSWSWGQVLKSSVLGPDWGKGNVSGISTSLAVVLGIAVIIASLMATILNLRAAEAKAPTLGSIWQEFRQHWLWAKLAGLAIMTGLITLVGFILLIVPGVILLWRLFLAPYILIDKKTGVIEALNQSWNMTKGYAWPIYSIILFTIVLALTNIIPFVGGLVAFVLATAYTAAPALRYQELKKAF